MDAAWFEPRQFRLGRRDGFADSRIIKAERSVETSHDNGFVVVRESQRGRPVGLFLKSQFFLDLGGVPQLDRAVIRRGEQPFAVGGEDQVQNRAFVSEFGFEDWVGRFRGRVADLPDANAIVRAAREEPFAVRRKGGSVKFLQRLRKSVAPFAGGYVPQFHGAIRAGAGQKFSVGPERQIEHAAVVAGKRFDFFTGFDLPEFDLLVVAASGQQLAIG